MPAPDRVPGQRHARSSSTAASALTPAAQSPGSACSAGEWETPVGLRTNSMRGRHPRGQHPRVVARPGGQHRGPDPGGGQGGHQPVAQRGVELHGGRDRLLGPAARSTPWAAAAGARPRSTSSTTACSRARPARGRPARRSPDELIALTAPGSAVSLPTVASAPCQAAACRARRASRRRTAASGHAGRRAWWCPAWSARPVKSAATGRAARSAPPSRSRRPGPPAPGPARCAVPRRRRWPRAGRRPGPMPPGSCPAAAIASASVMPPRVGQRPGPAGLDGAGQQPAAQAGDAEPAPSSSLNAATASGRTGRLPRSRSRSIAANAVTTPSGPSKAPPSGTESR